MLNLDATKHKPVTLTEEQYLALLVYRGYTHWQLKEAFELVQNKTHWKGPIDIVLPAGVTYAQIELIDAAVVFYTGGTAGVRRCLTTGKTHVTAAGYWACVGA